MVMIKRMRLMMLKVIGFFRLILMSSDCRRFLVLRIFSILRFDLIVSMNRVLCRISVMSLFVCVLRVVCRVNLCVCMVIVNVSRL